jgi:hypothetical protein
MPYTGRESKAESGDAVPFYVLNRQALPSPRIPAGSIVAPRPAFWTRQEAEAGLRSIAAACEAKPMPELQIVEADTIYEAMSQLSGSLFPPLDRRLVSPVAPGDRVAAWVHR